MKFIPALIIFVFTIFSLTNSETTYSGFTITSADPNNPCSISIPQTDVGTKCIDVCGLGNIDIAESGETNKYNINGYSATDQCTKSAQQETLTCGTPVTVAVYSIDCTPVAGVTTAETTTAATTAETTTAATTAETTTAATTAETTTAATTAETTTAATTAATTAETTTAATTAETTTAATTAETTTAATTASATTASATTAAATTAAATTTTTAASTTTGTSSTIVIPFALIIASLLLSVITL
ncbi:hypothetical protein ACTFIR_011552 [Dictyostelium discoideum]